MTSIPKSRISSTIRWIERHPGVPHRVEDVVAGEERLPRLAVEDVELGLDADQRLVAELVAALEDAPEDLARRRPERAAVVPERVADHAPGRLDPGNDARSRRVGPKPLVGVRDLLVVERPRDDVRAAVENDRAAVHVQAALGVALGVLDRHRLRSARAVHVRQLEAHVADPLLAPLREHLLDRRAVPLDRGHEGMIRSSTVLTSAVATAVGPDGIAELHALELPQKDNLCACFWGAIALRAAGVVQVDGEPVDQDRVAVEAGTLLPQGDPSTFVPRGESSRQDYRLPLAVASDPGAGGTAAPALARAVARLAEGRLAVVPVAGPWTGESVVRLVTAVAEVAPETTVVANLGTRWLWGTRPHPSTLLAYLAGQEPIPPPADWDTGHYVNLAAILSAPGRALVVVRDSYRSLGWEGYHLQPAEALAAALERDEDREGGVLCISPSSAEAALRQRLAGGGYDLRHWVNGTPDNAGAA